MRGRPARPPRPEGRPLLNIGKLAAGGEDYYLTTVARSVEAYYLGRGEAPGRWIGRGVELLGLEGRVEADPLRAVLNGTDPESGERLAAQQRKVPGFDLTFRAPKSVALAWALADGETSLEIRRIHDLAVAAALDYLERNAAFTRRGKGGTEQVQVDGFIGAAFRHRTSRANDPLLHTHVVIANLAHTPDDGRWRSLDARHLYTHAKTAGFLYQAQLRHELSRRLGVRWQPVRNGFADIEGVPRDVIEAFSRRRSEILDELDRVGHDSARAAQFATLATRQAKQTEPVDLHEAWRQRADELGFDTGSVQRLFHRPLDKAPDRTALRGIADRLLGPKGLTAKASTFTRREALQGWCLNLTAGATIADVERLADHLLDGYGRTVRLTPAGTVATGRAAGIRLRDGRLVATPEIRYSTPELLALEQRLIDQAVQRRTADTAVVEQATVEQVLGERPWLADEQAAAVRQLTSTGDGVAVVVGRAGSGKTSMLGAARAAWEQVGIPVVGVALAARAALELRNGSGIPATTIERLLLDVQRHGEGLPAGGVLVVDEAGMVGTRTLAKLTDLAERSGTKVVLVGDHHQLPEIEAGGAFAGLVNRLPAIELNDNRRQSHQWERGALDELRDGDVAQAVTAYEQHDRLVVAETVDALREQLVGEWWQAVDEFGTDALMIAARIADIDDLNARARQRLSEAGALTGSELDAVGRTFQVGDRILCLRNHRTVGVLNGTRGTVTRIDRRHHSLTFIRDDTGESVLLPADYLDAGWVDHGYALTAHKAQGITCEATFVLADEATYREWGYVALSRGRTANRIYVVEGPTDPDPPDDATHPGVLQEDERPAEVRLSAELRRSQRQALALEHLPSSCDEHAAEFTPPAYVTCVLGDRPTVPAQRQTWGRAVAAIERYRQQHGVTDIDRPLGARPADPAAREAYQQVLRELLHARRALAPTPLTEREALSPDLGMDLG